MGYLLLIFNIVYDYFFFFINDQSCSLGLMNVLCN